MLEQGDTSAVQQFGRALRSGGKLLVYVLAFQILFSSMDQKVGQHRRYRFGRLVQIIKASGPQVTYARYGHCLGFAAKIAYKMIVARDGSIAPVSARLYDLVIFPISRLFDYVAGYSVGKNAHRCRCQVVASLRHIKHNGNWARLSSRGQ